jgi:hypothetical protein
LFIFALPGAMDIENINTLGDGDVGDDMDELCTVTQSNINHNVAHLYQLC